MRVLSVVGARPQFVKAFAVSRVLRTRHEECLVHTGQHYDHELSAVFFDELGIPEPEYNLGVGSAPAGRQTGRMMCEFEPVLEREEPDAVLVYGDTNSTLAAALVAAKSDALLAHVEAGLRSDNRAMPEETNRVLTDHAADLLCAPTRRAVERLESEGLGDRVRRTGDVMYDTLLWARDHAESRSTAREAFGVAGSRYVLATVHRAGNTDDPRRLRAIVDALADRPEPVVFPAHPRTVDALGAAGELGRVRRELTVVDPVGYFDFIHLLDGAYRVVTDSGGVQKEAFFLDTPCVTLRGETEWPETVEAGWNVLADADPERIHRAIDRSFDLDTREKPQPYGDGDAAGATERALRRAVAGE
jgi:UDP-N-acetylglucosamine 2-epimerase